MCWRSSKKVEPQIAQHDIPIYKILSKDNKTFRSIYFGFKYELNKTYVYLNSCFKSIEFVTSSKEYEKCGGFHSYDLTKTTYSSTVIQGCVKVITIETKRKEYYLDSIYHRGNCIAVKGFIPKGSCYFVNDNGEYVSNQICLTEVL